MKKTHLVLSLIALFMITSCGPGKNAVKVDPYIGAWSILIENTPQGDVSSTMTILKNEANEYTGNVVSDVGTFELSNLNITDNKISANFVVQDLDFDITGTFESTVFKGFISGMGEDYTANGNKIVE